MATNDPKNAPSSEVSEEASANAGTKKAASASPQTPPKKSFKERAIRGLVLLVLALVALFFAYRWIGSTIYRGTVQRVYEKQAEYRVEFTELDGSVHVVGNQEIRFPYFKVDTADLHADLNRLAKSGDVVDVNVWGLRVAWFSMFPNIIDVTFVSSDSDRNRAKAELIADKVLEALTKKGVLKGGEGVRDDIVHAIENGMKAPQNVQKQRKKDN